MTEIYKPEFTYKQGAAVGLAGASLFFALIYFDQGQRAHMALSGLIALLSTLVIRRDLIRRRWFQYYFALMAITHLALVILIPPTGFDKSGFKLFVLGDILIVLASAFALEKLIFLRKRETQ